MRPAEDKSERRAAASRRPDSPPTGQVLCRVHWNISTSTESDGRVARQLLTIAIYHVPPVLALDIRAAPISIRLHQLAVFALDALYSTRQSFPSSREIIEVKSKPHGHVAKCRIDRQRRHEVKCVLSMLRLCRIRKNAALKTVGKVEMDREKRLSKWRARQEGFLCARFNDELCEIHQTCQEGDGSCHLRVSPLTVPLGVDTSFPEAGVAAFKHVRRMTSRSSSRHIRLDTAMDRDDQHKQSQDESCRATSCPRYEADA